MNERVVTHAARFGRVPVETLLLRTDVTDQECRLYAYLTTYDYGRTGECWPGRDAVSKDLDWSLSKVARTLRDLEGHGLIERKQAGAGRPGTILLLADVIAARSPMTRLPDQPGHIEPSARSHAENAPISTRKERAHRDDAQTQLVDDDTASGFDQWWDGYPKKKDKARARKLYDARRREGASLGDLLRARDAYLAEHVDTETKYLKHPTTFLAKDGPWTEYLDGPSDSDGDVGTIAAQLARQSWDGPTPKGEHDVTERRASA